MRRFARWSPEAGMLNSGMTSSWSRSRASSIARLNSSPSPCRCASYHAAASTASSARLFEDADSSHQRRFRRDRIRRRSSSRSISFAVPASIAASLREISRSHASSTPLSFGASRLRTRSRASSARSASERPSASNRSRSRFALIGTPSWLLVHCVDGRE